jgi:hypothetical protein
MVYLALFGIGHILIGPLWEGLALLVGSAICAAILYNNISKSGWKEGTPALPAAASRTFGH